MAGPQSGGGCADGAADRDGPDHGEPGLFPVRAEAVAFMDRGADPVTIYLEWIPERQLLY